MTNEKINLSDYIDFESVQESRGSDMTVDTISAAKHLCKISNWSVTNLQLQKVLYMADMNFVGQGKGRIVPEDFEAWDYGPVLPSLYHHCKAFGSKPLRDIFWGAEDISGTAEAKMLEVAWENLKDRAPFELVATTHSPLGAWIKKYVPGARQIKISTDDMINEYRQRRSRSAAQAT